mmetsp:Transcript_4991/g.12154  ORF Transcript_4991/g.12154 Transcript_4991/m.12154 type:complete len:663 (+) Transcript_4991:52-2040(+)
MMSAAGGGDAAAPVGAAGPAASYGAANSVVDPDNAPQAGARFRLPASTEEVKALMKEGWKKAKAELKVTFKDLPALIVPWVLFCVVLVPTGLYTTTSLGYCALALGIALGIGFLLLSYGRAWKTLAVTCLVAVALGEGLGVYDRYKYLNPYFIYLRSPWYTDVLSSAQPDAYRDAGFLGFSADAQVDPSMGLGYQSGDQWCVAPIVGMGRSERRTGQPTGFWAVGKDCCNARGQFQCGNLNSNKVHGGLIVKDLGSFDDAQIPTYTLAAQAASKTYGLRVPKEPIFVEWSTQPSSALAAMYGDAVNFVILAVAIFFIIVPLMALMLSCLDLALTDRDNDEHWHTDRVENMKFGFEFVPKNWSRDVTLDLMNNRCYWSGEVIYDYAFHIANKHMYFGVLFCHPAHPYSKWERLVVCIIVSLFIIFPVSAFSVTFGSEGSLHTLVTLVLVTVPRNVLKLYLIQITQEDSLEELEEGANPDGARVRSALQWEIGFLALCGVLCGLTVAICTIYIQSATTQPLGEVLRENCDGLGFAFILEPLFDLVIPFVGLDAYEGTWTLGFFGRWRRERNHYESKVHQQQNAEKLDADAAMRQLELNRGRPRPLFRDAGTEILLAPEAQFRHRSSRRPKLGAYGGYDPAVFVGTGYQQADAPFETVPSGRMLH